MSLTARKPFTYRGRIPASKSILNRLLVLQSFQPSLAIEGDSKAEDVSKMKSALRQLLESNEPADCGAAGTTFRFLVHRASRIPGRHRLTGTKRLLERPQEELKKILAQLGCEFQIKDSFAEVTVPKQGWQKPQEKIRIDRSISSQFASALVLSAWDLPFDLEIEFEGAHVSEGYFTMTLALARRAGMNWKSLTTKRLLIPAGSRITARELDAESDLSSAFSIAAIAAVRGEAVFEEWPMSSLQPDAVFPRILESMGVEIKREPEKAMLTLRSKGSLRGVREDLSDCPDLFPVLAVLCSLAEGPSRLSGAPHLEHKESKRISKSAELVQLLGRDVKVIDGGLEIQGRKPTSQELLAFAPVEFHPSEDHRLAMAAAVASAAGFAIQIAESQAVEKSFPEFWAILEQGGVKCARL